MEDLSFKFTSVLLTQMKSFTIISSLMSLLLKRFISTPLLVLSFCILLNKLYFFAEKQKPWYILSLSCTEKLKYFLFLSFEALTEKHLKGTPIKMYLMKLKITKSIPNKWCARGLGFLVVLKTLSLATLFFLYKHNVYKHTQAEKTLKVKHMLSIIQAWDLI